MSRLLEILLGEQRLKEVAVIQSSYVHTIKGRLRVNVSCIKRNRLLAAELERQLLSLEGINRVTANPVTGNVLIQYDAERLGHGYLLDWLCQQGYVIPRQGNLTGPQSATGMSLPADRRTRYIWSTMELVLQRALWALI